MVSLEIDGRGRPDVGEAEVEVFGKEEDGGVDEGEDEDVGDDVLILEGLETALMTLTVVYGKDFNVVVASVEQQSSPSPVAP